MIKPWKVTHKYVFVVYECAHRDGETETPGTVLGVYINLEEAMGKAEKERTKGTAGYICVLKKPLQGKSLCRL